MNLLDNAAAKPVSIVAIGAGNRMRTYMHYVKQHPDKVVLVAVVEPDAIRRDAMADEFHLGTDRRFTDYQSFFRHPVKADAVIICTPENAHFEPCMEAIAKGYHILLEKPVAQTMEQCRQIAEAAHRAGVMVGVCHVLRYLPCFKKIKELVDSGELGQIISINHVEGVGLDRMTHSYVRGIWNRQRESNPMFLAKCCHDVDFLLWITRSRCHSLNSYGSLRWFRKENAPEGSADRCVDCQVETSCPFSAVNLYERRHDWISNFDVPEGQTIDDVIRQELRNGRYGRCVFRCDNDVVDNQCVTMELQDKTTITLSMKCFTQSDHRTTSIQFTKGEIRCDESKVYVRHFLTCRRDIYDYEENMAKPFHGGADLDILEDFVRAVSGNPDVLPTSIDEAIESHRLCFEVERSRMSGQTVIVD